MKYHLNYDMFTWFTTFLRIFKSQLWEWTYTQQRGEERRMQWPANQSPSYSTTRDGWLWPLNWDALSLIFCSSYWTHLRSRYHPPASPSPHYPLFQIQNWESVTAASMRSWCLLLMHKSRRTNLGTRGHTSELPPPKASTTWQEHKSCW